mgnify:CR=1 FL=1|tara:strand:- start:195 stop:521 length:327 start_codon:yes stop_codon:yes gene_type:complete
MNLNNKINNILNANYFFKDKIAIYESLEDNWRKLYNKYEQLFLTNPTNVNIEDAVGIILHRGIPDGIQTCKQCNKIFENTEFKYHQDRVNKDGYLIMINDICVNCLKK